MMHMCLSGLVTSIFTLSLIGTPCIADERHIDFIEQLQERGYHDIVVDYVERIRNRPDAAGTVGILADFYIGRSLVAGAEMVPDLVKRDEQLQRGRSYLDKFVRSNPDHDRAADAQMDMAQVLVEQGHIARLQADNPNNSARKQDLLRQARSLYDSARQSFSDARERLKNKLKTFPASIPEEQKRLRDAKTLTQVHMMQAHLHQGMVEYDVAQTYDRGSSNYTSSLTRAIAVFEDVRQQFRDRLGGQYARMWQGKCYEEMGELVKAESIYKDLLEQDDKDPAMLSLQRQVHFFQIIVFNRRSDYQLAANFARQWLQEYAKDRHTEIGFGVQLEQARAFIQQAESTGTKGSDRNRLLSQALDNLAIVARSNTIYKQPAITLDQKVRAMMGSTGGLATYDQAVAMGDSARDRNAWSEAVGQYTQALRLAKASLDADALASVRYKLALVYYQAQKYYEAAVLGEYVAQHHAESSVAAPAGHVAIEALARIFNESLTAEQPTDFEEAQIVRLAAYMNSKWPATPESNAARLLLGDLHLHFGRFDAAGAAFEAVTPGSPDYAHSLARAGDTFWRLYTDEATKPPEERASEKMSAALERSRRDWTLSIAEFRKSVTPDATPPAEMAEVAISLAEASIEAGQSSETVRLMQEFVPRLRSHKDLQSLELRGLVALLRGCIAIQDLRAAEDAMKTIEATGKDVAQITRVYLDLGKQLQAEMERLKASGDQQKYDQTRNSYLTFLDQMAQRREGQTFLTLQWTGEAFFGLGMYDRAGERFSQIVRQAANDAKFLDQSKPENRMALLQAKIRYVTLLRKQRRHTEAWDQIKPLAPESNTGKDPMHVGATTNLDIILERGMVLEEWGANVPAQLKIAIDHWAYWGAQLEKLTPRPVQYWDVRLHLLRCLIARARKPADPKDREQRLRQAEQQLLLLSKTSATLGGPAYKSQFKQIQAELEREIGRPLESTAPTKGTKPAGN
jgi:tetratricopeptide (TPR) repeat protein